MCSRALTTFCGRVNSRRSRGAGCSGTVTDTPLPQGPCPYGASKTTAGQSASANSGCCQPCCSLSAQRHPAPVTSSTVPPEAVSTIRRTRSPPGLTDALPRLVASAASTIRPPFAPRTRSVTSARCPLRQASVRSAWCSTSCPSRYRVKSSSAVATRVALRISTPAGRVTCPRNQRGPAGAELEVEPGDQIHDAPSKPGGSGAAEEPIQNPCHASFGNVVSHQRGVLHADGRPAPSQTLTCQW